MKPKRGRPKSENPKAKILGVRLPDDEREIIERAAASEQKTASEWAREILVAKARKTL